MQDVKSTNINPYVCPVSGKQIVNYAAASDGHYYEEQHIIELLQKGQNSPITGLPFPTNIITKYYAFYTTSIYPNSFLSLDSRTIPLIEDNITSNQSNDLNILQGDSDSHPENKSGSNPETILSVETNSETECETKPETESETKPETGSETKPETGSETIPDTGSKTKPETGSETKPETGSETIPDTGSETKPETGSETIPDTGSETKPETASETKPETRSGIKCCKKCSEAFFNSILSLNDSELSHRVITRLFDQELIDKENAIDLLLKIIEIVDIRSVNSDYDDWDVTSNIKLDIS